MARYRDRSREQTCMVPVHLDDQLQPGTFEHTIDYLVDNEIDLSVFESRKSGLGGMKSVQENVRNPPPDFGQEATDCKRARTAGSCAALKCCACASQCTWALRRLLHNSAF